MLGKFEEMNDSFSISTSRILIKPITVSSKEKHKSINHLYSSIVVQNWKLGFRRTLKFQMFSQLMCMDNHFHPEERKRINLRDEYEK